MEFAYINNILQVPPLGINLIKQIGFTSISCPQKSLLCYDFVHRINVIAIHTSCFLETRGTEYNLQIRPNTTSPPLGIPTLLLMSYNINQEIWVPQKGLRWIIQIVLMSVLSVVIFSIIIGILFMIFTKPWTVRVDEFIKTEETEMALKAASKLKDALRKRTDKLDIEQQPEKEIGSLYKHSYENYDSNIDPTTYFEDTFKPELQNYYATVRKPLHYCISSECRGQHKYEDQQACEDCDNNLTVRNHQINERFPALKSEILTTAQIH